MQKELPVIGITMGDPVGIGPEIIMKALAHTDLYSLCRPVVIGDTAVLESASRIVSSGLSIRPVSAPDMAGKEPGTVDVIETSTLDPATLSFGAPTPVTGKAMVDYITSAVNLAISNTINGVVTAPINKVAMKLAGSRFHGHTEMIAEMTGSDSFLMMMTGSTLSVVLVTIHVSLSEVPSLLTTERILSTIRICGDALSSRFGIKRPRIAVSALNPHAGEEGMFGHEEETLILPAIRTALKEGYHVSGPHPPDTVFYNAAKGQFDVVVCMYHDQGLIPFKMLHFSDGVNTTLGLPIIRTSVDHGTAYDIAGSGKADEGSLLAAIHLAARQSACSMNRIDESSGIG